MGGGHFILDVIYFSFLVPIPPMVKLCEMNL